MLSIIIPTYNRAKQLEELVESIFNQEYKDFEIIISDDGSTDDTCRVVKKLQARYPDQIIYAGGGNEGRANARNRGAALAKGDILLFFDDDVLINPLTIAEHVSFHLLYIDEDIIADGPALYDFTKIKGDFQRWRAEREMGWYEKSDKPVLKDHAGLVGANKSIKRSFFNKTGGLKHGLNDSEDFEFAYRAMHKYGAKIYTIYNAWVFHQDYKSLKEYIYRYKLGMASARKLYEEYPEIIRDYPSRWVFNPPFHMKIITPLFSSKLMIEFASSRLFSFLPKCIRWKFYEWIVTSSIWYNI